MTDVPASHPRRRSLEIRDLIVDGVERGITSPHGLIAHGRGEAFDYLLGERSHDFAELATRAAAALLVSCDAPVVSVNGNAAALVGPEMVRLAAALGAPVEVNIFHASAARERAIRGHLQACGAAEVLMPSTDTELPFLESNRRFVNPNGIHRADVVFVPLEDGDRCQALRRAGKDVVTVDLNPLSRTAQTSSVTIVDNVVRAMPALLGAVAEVQRAPAAERARLRESYDHAAVLAAAERCIRARQAP